jgi:multidrug efflux pump subunit AcrA (membrane-fusion protein)
MSDVALKRARDLYRADKTVSAETLETAERQAAADQAQLAVARAHASLQFGAAPWLGPEHREALLASLARGEMLVVSASFPSGLPAVRPGNLALRRVGREINEFWITTEIWTGPSDPSVPGPTMLGLLSTPAGLSYGERLIASVATGPEVAGSVVPASAVVLSGGEGWCYVEESDDVLARRRVDLGRPLAQGYFQASGFEPGEHVVIAGAGLLLARETGGAAASD